jgi:pyridoxine 5-phosphate synthase
MIRLGVNIDHVATVRQARRTFEPDPVAAAVLAMLGGADGITVHLREDRRHIQERDLRLLRPVVQRLNLEMAAVDEIVQIALDVRPDEATLVPEKRAELTTEGGLDVVGHADVIGSVVRRLAGAGIIVSLFIDPDPAQVEMSKRLGAQAVEFCTARYAEARDSISRHSELERLRESASLALERQLAVHMGHGLTYENVRPVAAIPGVCELNIGHSIVSRAVLVGMERAVREMKAILSEVCLMTARPSGRGSNFALKD